MDHTPPVLHHNSRGRSTSACNCGRKQAPREDPFDVQSANWDFFLVSAHHSVVVPFLYASLDLHNSCFHIQTYNRLFSRYSTDGLYV